MKNFKIKTLLMGLSLLFVCSACDTKEEPEGPGTTPTLSIPVEPIEFVFGGETKTLQVTTNQEKFTVTTSTGDDVWCHLTIEGKTVKILVDANPLQAERSTSLTVQAASLKKRVRVVQVAAPAPPKNPRSFEIPAFTEGSFIYKIMNGEKQMGVICKEYLRGTGIDNQAIVVYPMLATAIDFTRGVVAKVLSLTDTGEASDKPLATDVHGGSVAFDAATNAIITYLAGTQKPAAFISIDEDGNIAIIDALSADKATLVADKMYDKESNEYGLVKIGTQIWIQQNLRVTKMNDGTSIAKDVTGEAWMTTAAYRETCEPTKLNYGFLYNAVACGYANGSFLDKLSPDGYTIPSNDHWTKLQKYVGDPDCGGKLKTIGNDDWDPWVPVTIASNITGFSAVGSSYGNGDGTLAPDGTKAHVFYISSTTYDGGLSRFNINRSGASGLLQPEGGHAIGYAVRLLKY